MAKILLDKHYHFVIKIESQIEDGDMTSPYQSISGSKSLVLAQRGNRGAYRRCLGKA